MQSALKYVVATLILSLFSFSASAAKVTFSLEWLISGRHAGLFTALDKGYYKDAGLDVTIERGYGSADTVKRVATGAADLGIADAATVLAAIANTSAPVIMVSTFFNGDPSAILTLKSSNITSASQLGGKRIGGGSTSASLKILPALAALAKFSDYSTVPMASDQIYPALLTKQVDAITGFTDNAATMTPQAKKQGDAIVTLPYSDYGVVNYGSAIVAKRSSLADQGKTIASFLEASMKGIKYAVAHPDEAIAILHKYAPAINPDIERAVFEADIPLFVTDETKRLGLGSITPERVDATYSMTKQYLGLKNEIDPKTTFTTEYLPKSPILP